MRTKSPFKQTDIARAIKGAEKGGLSVRSVEIKADGTIRLSSEAATSDNDNKEPPKVSSI